MNKAVITGASGFIGGALCRELSEQGAEIAAVVHSKNSDTSSISHLPRIKIIYCDSSQYKNLAHLITDRDIDVLYHLAWTGSAGQLRADYNTQLDNIRYSCDLLTACKELGCKRFVFAASLMEYEISALMKSDTGLKAGINTLYCTAKLSADYMLRALANSLGIDYIRAVISNVYGPGEKNPRLINTAIKKLLNKEHCAFTAGEQMYDFIYITDAAKVFAKLGEKGTPDRTYYIGSLNPKPLKEFLTEMRDTVREQNGDSSSDISLGEIPFNGVSLTYREFDTEAVKKDTGFVPEISFTEGIRKTVKWLKNRRDTENVQI